MELVGGVRLMIPSPYWLKKMHWMNLLRVIEDDAERMLTIIRHAGKLRGCS